MHPILFHLGPFTLYTYGFFIALGAVLGALYMWWQGSRRYGMTFDQANMLFLLLIFAGVVGGKLFLVFEDPSFYFSHPGDLLTNNGFVFYGSLLVCIPTMLWYFKKNKLPIAGMLDVMAVVTCIVHGFGRIGCFNAGCCYGKPTASFLGVVFTDPQCQAQPLNVSLHPTQLYEATAIFLILIALLFIDRYKKFDGQVFLTYLISYAIVRSVIELFRGDLKRGFVIDGVLSYSQFISLILAVVASYIYVKFRRKTNFPLPKLEVMENESMMSRLAKSTKRIVKRIIIIALLLGIIVISFTYWGVYERGVMAGKVLRITQKGVIFKTYEGKISLDTFGALKGASPIAETFDFSVESDETKVIKELEQVALSGERVNLKFVKRYTTFLWRGDTKYFVVEIERTK